MTLLLILNFINILKINGKKIFITLLDIFNSFFLASSVAILTLLFVIPAAYSYARFNFPFKNSSLYILLAINMFSGAVLLIPLYKVLRTFGLLNSYQAMIVPGVAFLIPTSIWLLKSYFEKIPVDLEEAAFVEDVVGDMVENRSCFS